MVEPNLSRHVEDSGTSRNTREVLAVRPSARPSAGERAQIEAAARLQEMALSSYLRCAALQASAVAVGRASVAPARPAPARPVPVIEPVPAPKVHYVDGEVVRR
jgi:hypothetical protein